MGLIGLLTGKRRVQFVVNNKTVIQIDASVKENHSRKAQITEFPLETGKDISDSSILKPFNLEIVGMISDTPIGGVKGLLTEAATTATSALTPALGVVGAAGGVALLSAITGSKSPSVAAYLQLLQLQELAQPFTVITSLQRYANMLIEDLSVPREAANGNALEFTVKLKQVLLVTPQSVNISIFADPALSATQANVGDGGLQLSKQYQQGFSTAQAAVQAVTGGIGG